MKTKSKLFIMYKKEFQLECNIKKLRNIDDSLSKTSSKKQSIIEKSNLYEIDKIYWLIEDGKKYGTISFAK